MPDDPLKSSFDRFEARPAGNNILWLGLSLFSIHLVILELGFACVVHSDLKVKFAQDDTDKITPPRLIHSTTSITC